MSFRASKWATRQTAGSATAKLVLLVLAEAADDDGFTFLGQEEIANRAELTRRAVIDQMARLQEVGLIRRERRVNAQGYRTSDAVYLRLEAASQGEPDVPRGCVQGERSARRASANVNVVHLGLSEPDARLSEPDDVPTCTTFTGIGQRTVREPSAPEQSRKATPRRKSETRLPDGFPTPQDLTWARERAAKEGKRIDLERQAERFRNHAQQTDRRCRDWSAAWRNWIDKTLETSLAVPRVAMIQAETDPWPARVRGFTKNGYWRTDEWGPQPGRTGCIVPVRVLDEFGWAA